MEAEWGALSSVFQWQWMLRHVVPPSRFGTADADQTMTMRYEPDESDLKMRNCGPGEADLKMRKYGPCESDLQMRKLWAW